MNSVRHGICKGVVAPGESTAKAEWAQAAEAAAADTEDHWEIESPQAPRDRFPKDFTLRHAHVTSIQQRLSGLIEWGAFVEKSQLKSMMWAALRLRCLLSELIAICPLRRPKKTLNNIGRELADAHAVAQFQHQNCPHAQ
ncbi:MAG: hypothetical protein ABIV63_15385 [Caldimonas sp.]